MTSMILVIILYHLNILIQLFFKIVYNLKHFKNRLKNNIQHSTEIMITNYKFKRLLIKLKFSSLYFKH